MYNRKMDCLHNSFIKMLGLSHLTGPLRYYEYNHSVMNQLGHTVGVDTCLNEHREVLNPILLTGHQT